ncbi:MAG TPA: MBG domain-containing protein [Verrucomicrobiae bacterium]|nr:MBG domain-containing protein [Verrucomicrobiae bacterium]
MPIRTYGGLCSRLVALSLVVVLVGQTILAAGLVREPNATLALPLEPYEYSAVEAFPGLLFNQPVALVSPPGETNRLFIVEKEGRIQVITNLVNPTRTLFLDITSQVDPAGEGGLLGLAFHPGYQTNRYFYVYYTLNTTTSVGTGFHDRVARFEVSPTNPNQALSNSELPLITQLDEASNHNGGDVHFGLDGYLYVSLGDEGGGYDTFNNSRFITKDFFCAILRIDVDHRPGSVSPNSHPASTMNYAIPPDNPFIGAANFDGVVIDPNTVRTEFWAVGLRNPFRFSFDPVTGRLYCGDVGQDAWEEIDIIVKGGNYGWSYREGNHPLLSNPPPPGAVNAPIFEYGRSLGACVIGGVVYRGTRIPQLFGEYIFGDFSSGNIWALHYDGTTATNLRRLTTLGGVGAFGRDPANGDVLMVQASGMVPVYRLVYRNDITTSLPPTLADTGAFVDVATLQPEAGIVTYDLNVPFWSDHARKTRWFSVPETNQFIGFDSNSNWSFPIGTVWIKHFDLELTNGVPASARRLETRFLVRNSGGVYGVTYRWDDAQTNAFLVPEEGMDETFQVHDGGTVRTQVWHYPGRTECLTCHTPAGGLALGFNTFQLNRNHDDGGTITHQILGLSQMAYFSTPVTNVAGLLAYAPATHEAAAVEHRVRSYLGANCVQCHQPGGTGRGTWDARLATPLSEAGIINGTLIDDHGDTNNRVIKPGSLEHSMLLGRIAELGPRHMPPLATSELNQEAIALLARWITNDLAAITVSLPAGEVVYTENDGLVVLDSTATATAGVGVSLAGGNLTVEFSVNGAVEDRLAVRHVGSGSGEIGVSGSEISYGGVAVGTLAGGVGGAPLVVSFNSSVTPAAAQAVLRSVTYENVSPTPSTLTRTLRATLSANGASSQAAMTISVRSVPDVPVVTWNQPADIAYGTPLTETELNASASVPGTFVFDPPIGSVLNAGTDRLLSAAFTPQDSNNYTTVTASNFITVTKAPLVITAEDKSKVYGQPNPPLTTVHAGFVNGDTVSSLDTPVTLTTTANPGSPPGVYPIVSGNATDANYAISFVNGTLTVSKAPLVITADDKAKVYGQANPLLTASYSGFVNGESLADLDTSVSLTTPALQNSPQGSYPIVVTGASDANYQITFIDGILTIEPNAHLASIILESGGRIRIRFTGLSGRAYRIEASGDLSSWATAGTVQPDAGGAGEFSESAVSDGSAARFYRVAWP